MKKLFFLTISLSLVLATQAAIVTYTPDTVTNFPNPERGFYRQIEQNVVNASSNLFDNTLTDSRRVGRSLVLRMYYLVNFREQALTDEVLQAIRTDWETLRRCGCKAIVRFAYSSSNSGQYKDASPEIWATHLEQLKPVLAEGEDVLVAVQAGFLGVWGEWYYSSLGTGTQIPHDVRINLIDQLLDAVPVSRAVQLRTPAYKYEYVGDQLPLTEADAFSGTARARLGHHNDACLNGSGNMGTYENRKEDMAYLAEDCRFVPNGGETNLESGQAVYNHWCNGWVANRELGYLHYSYLNTDYAGFVIRQWKEEGYYDVLARSFGYRFTLDEAVLPDSVRIGDKLPLRMLIRNYGYAAPFNQRPAKIVLVSDAETPDTVIVDLHSDPRMWRSNRCHTVVTDSLILPEDMVAGNYRMYLWLPDAAENLSLDSRFAIRMANEDMWQEETGYNDLHFTVAVASDCTTSTLEAGSEPDPDPEPYDALVEVANGVNEHCTKFMQGGKLFIRHNDRIYSAFGQLVQ